MEIQIEDLGKPDGTFEDLRTYLKSALTERDSESAIRFGIAVNMLKSRFGTEITTKFLRDLIDDRNKNIRISYIIKKSGFKTIPIIRYRKGMLNSKSSKIEKVFRNIKGKAEIIDEKRQTIGIFHKGKWAEILHKLITEEEFNKIQQRLTEIRQKHTEEWANQKVEDKLTYRQERAVERLRIGKERFIEVNCPRCKHLIRYPTTPNLETDRVEALVSGIYACAIKDNRLCWRCEEEVKNEENWKTKEIVEFLGKLGKGKFYKFSAEQFCEEFREYGDLVEVGYLRRKLSEWLVNADVKTSENLIKIRI